MLKAEHQGLDRTVKFLTPRRAHVGLRGLSGQHLALGAPYALHYRRAAGQIAK